MNHIYKTVCNPRLGLWQAVAENAKGKSKSRRSASRLLAGAVALASGLAAQQAMAATIDGGGTVTVTPTAPQAWSVAEGLVVGGSGIGTLNILSGGAVSSTGESIGSSASGAGTVNVNGIGSTWTTINLFVGQMGTGTLNIQNGSTVSGRLGTVGHTNGGIGKVTVDGSGSTWTNSIDLHVGFNGTGTLTIQNGGTVSSTGTTTVGSNGTGNGTLNLNGTAGARGMLTTNDLTKGSGTAVFNWNGGILRANGNKANYLIGFSAGGITVGSNGAYFDTNGYNVGVTTASLLAGTGGLTKLGAGTLTLAGANTYSGNTTVSAGTLRFATYNQSASQTLSVGASSNSSYGKLAVTGTATFNAGANLAVDVASANSLAVGQTMSGVISAGTLSASTFAVTDNSALFNFKAVLNGNAVDLSVERGITAQGAVAEAGLDSAAGAAAVLDTLLNGSTTGDMATVMAAFGTLGTNREVARAAAQTLPQSGVSAVQQVLGTFNQVVQTRQDAGANGALGPASADVRYASASEVPPKIAVPTRQIWGRTFGSRADQASQHGSAGFGANTWGLALGNDTLLARDLKQQVGMAYAYATTRVDRLADLAGAAQNANVDTHVLAVYGARALPQDWRLSWQADLGISNTKASRTINFGGLNRVASSEHLGYSAHAGLGVARNVALDAHTLFTPVLHADYSWVRSQAYTESGAGALNLQVDAQTQETLVLGADAKVSHVLKSGAKVSAYLGVGYDTLNQRSTMVAAYAGAPGQPFTTTGANPTPWIGRGGLAYTQMLAHGIEAALHYDVESRDALLNQSVAVKATWTF